MKAGLETGTFVQHLMLIRSQISHHFIVYMLLSLNFPQNTQKKDSDTRQSSNMQVGFLCRCDDDKGTIVFFFFSLRFYRLNICWKSCQNPWHYGQHKRENHDYLLLHSIPSMIHLEPYIFFISSEVPLVKDVQQPGNLSTYWSVTFKTWAQQCNLGHFHHDLCQFRCLKVFVAAIFVYISSLRTSI